MVLLWSKSAIVRASLRTLKNSRFDANEVVSRRCLAAGSRWLVLKILLMLAVPLGAPNSAFCLENTPVTVFFTSFCDDASVTRRVVLDSSLRFRMMSKRLSSGLERFLR